MRTVSPFSASIVLRPADDRAALQRDARRPRRLRRGLGRGLGLGLGLGLGVVGESRRVVPRCVARRSSPGWATTNATTATASAATIRPIRWFLDIAAGKYGKRRIHEPHRGSRGPTRGHSNVTGRRAGRADAAAEMADRRPSLPPAPRGRRRPGRHGRSLELARAARGRRHSTRWWPRRTCARDFGYGRLELARARAAELRCGAGGRRRSRSRCAAAASSATRWSAGCARASWRRSRRARRARAGCWSRPRSSGIGADFHDATAELRDRGFGVVIAHPERSADAEPGRRRPGCGASWRRARWPSSTRCR